MTRTELATEIPTPEIAGEARLYIRILYGIWESWGTSSCTTSYHSLSFSDFTFILAFFAYLHYPTNCVHIAMVNVHEGALGGSLLTI